MNTRALSSIFTAELRLLVRNTAVAVSALLMPLVIGGMFVVSGLQQAPAAGWGFYVALMLLTVFGMSGCIAAAGTLTYRRDELYLKRLRCSEASDATILAGVLAPVVVVTVVQCLLMVVVTAVAAESLPANPVLLVAVIVFGTVCSVGLGMATTGFASSGEQAQTVATPVFFVLIGTAIWAATDLAEGLSTVQMLSPGGAVVQLTQLAYTGAPLSETASGALPALGGLVAWAVLGAGAAKRYFRWEPRH
ncbi:ABC transporter permease [Saccharomonospora cyanea]|uniref:ABC-type multidrug transport system, permease component n=1 Tax=Saccharomonospora cyanea NA-134 TaxID=882082 RepID=H5XDH2_9PSEU|nr:ABC transporter permease [Saccharomonospora cyanea]EHR60264.1 ABC-type multidrug transport system, permease component [Saccharomonospora cyanea NA-134]